MDAWPPLDCVSQGRSDFFWKHMEAICGLYPWIKNQRMRLCNDASFGKNAMDRKPFLSMSFLSKNRAFFSSLFLFCISWILGGFND